MPNKIYKEFIAEPILALPHCLNIQSITELFTDDPKTYAESAIWFLSYIYTTGLFRYNHKSAPVGIHSKTLEFILGKKTLKSGNIKRNTNNTTITQYNYIIRKLETNGLIEVNREFKYNLENRKEGYPQSYRLNIRNEEDAYLYQQSFILKSNVLVKKFNQLIKKDGVEFKKKSREAAKVFDSIMGVEYDSDAAEKELIEKDRVYHDKLKNGVMTWKQDKQNRIYTIIGIIPKRLRKFLTWNGKPLWQVDVSSSQVNLHILLYQNDCEEKSRLTALCENNQFYEYLNSKLADPYNLSDDEEKTEFKRKIFEEVFYGHPESKKERELLKAFTQSFPILAQLIKEKKGTGGQYRELPKAMQWIESHIILNGVVEDIELNGPIITIHDCILTTEENLAKVNELMKDMYFSTCGVRIRTKIARVSV